MVDLGATLEVGGWSGDERFCILGKVGMAGPKAHGFCPVAKRGRVADPVRAAMPTARNEVCWSLRWLFYLD